MVHAVDQVLDGELVMDPLVAQSLTRRRRHRSDDIEWLISFLTQREREVLRRIVTGQSTEEMARDMAVTRSTARTHVQNVLQKLGVHSRLQAVAAVANRARGDLRRPGGPDMATHLNVAVADRQLTFADSVARRLLAQGVAAATAHTSLEALLADLAENPADVVLLDWSLCSSLERCAARAARAPARDPGRGRRRPARAAPDRGSHAGGALGWAPKDISFEQLVSGLLTVSRGDRWVPEGLVALLLEAMTRPGDSEPGERLLYPLTRREREVLQCMVDGLSRWETAVALSMSPNTVRTHVQSVLHKLNVHSSLRAVALAREAGLSARPQIPHQRPGN